MRTFWRAVVIAVAATTLSAAGGTGSAVPVKPDDKPILHVLNRAGFGARPGDVERVRQVGLAAYIEQQLQPQRIPDAAIAARLEPFATLTKSSRELAETYFAPAQIAKQRARREAAAGASLGDAPARTPAQ